MLRKKPGDEVFRVSFKFPRGGGDQRLAERYSSRFWDSHANTRENHAYTKISGVYVI